MGAERPKGDQMRPAIELYKKEMGATSYLSFVVMRRRRRMRVFAWRQFDRACGNNESAFDLNN